jgi:hypothetical protein
MDYRWAKVGANQEDLMVFDRGNWVLHFLANWRAAGVSIPEGAAQDEIAAGALVAQQVIAHAQALHLSRSKVNELNQAFSDVVFLGTTWPGAGTPPPAPEGDVPSK